MKKSLIDLFAGCGGLSLGMEQAGFSPVFVNEINSHFKDLPDNITDRYKLGAVAHIIQNSGTTTNERKTTTRTRV